MTVIGIRSREHHDRVVLQGTLCQPTFLNWFKSFTEPRRGAYLPAIGRVARNSVAVVAFWQINSYRWLRYVASVPTISAKNRDLRP